MQKSKYNISAYVIVLPISSSLVALHINSFCCTKLCHLPIPLPDLPYPLFHWSPEGFFNAFAIAP